MEQEFLSIKEVAVIFGVHQVTIRRAIKRGYIIALRIGNGSRSPYRISRKCIEAIHGSIIRDMATRYKLN
jgi:excisionase family DNA binding protein